MAIAIALPGFKVQLTPKNVFRLYKSPCFSDHRCKKIIVVAIFVEVPMK